LDGVALDADQIGFDIARDRRTEPLAGLDLTASTVKRTFNDIALQPALAEQRLGARADIIGGVKFTADVVHCDPLWQWRCPFQSIAGRQP
jgi:hypothetical protein